MAGMTSTGVVISQLDDNMANGRTYTFQFKCDNWFCLSDISQAIANGIVEYAPDFIQSLQVTSPTFTSLYNVQFTYEGDGSDVISDVALSIIGAVQAYSNDKLTFVGAVATGAADIVVTPIQAVKTTEQVAVGAAGQIVTDVTSTASSAVNKSLVGLLPLLLVIVAIILFVLPSLAASYSKVGPRVSVG